MKILGMFPGQGSQSVGMGKDFFENSDRARSTFEKADKALGFPLSKLCFDGPLEQLTLTENAQPAILLVSVISFQHAGISLDAGAGHSLGEYSALVASGALELEDALRLVNKRGRYMQEAVEPGAGKMVAVMGADESAIRAAIGSVSNGVAEIANLNSPGQTVVAGDVPGVDAFSAAVLAAGGKVIPLNVSAPFHCSLMKPAADKLAKDLDALTFKDPEFPIYANVTAAAVKTGAEARELLKKQVCGSVRWSESMTNAVQSEDITHAVEFGAGGVLSKLLKRIAPGVARIEIENMAGLEKAKALTSR